MAPALEQQSRMSTTGLRGLTEAEVMERRARGEVNIVPRGGSRSYGRIISQNLCTFLNLLIFGISVVLVILGLYIDALLAGLLGVVNAAVAIIQEVRAKHALDRIAVLTRPVATVIRDGREQVVQIGDIVRDDLVVVRTGDQVVADGPVVASVSLSADESLLTGESELVPKAIGDTLYSGTFCATGQAVYRAEQIGSESTAEQIDVKAHTFRNLKTPLQREIIWLMRGLLVLILLLAILVLGTFNRFYQGFPVEETIIQDASRAMAVMIGLVPQGLVLMITITYAMAIIRLSRKNALIQRMNAVESLSHVDVLCLDKTGTITTNNLILHELYPVGTDLLEFQQVLGDFVASSSSGNRTSSAIGDACNGKARAVRMEVPFSSARKWSGLIFDGDALRGAYILGAPEILRPALRCDMRIDECMIEEWTTQGLRVLLFACRSDVTSFGETSEPVLPLELVPLGLVALRDELRADARGTIERFVQAGIVLKVISGDHANTIAALARQAGLRIQSDQEIVTGQDLEGLDDAGYERAANQATIFGRVTPQQKEELIKALIRQGHYVAMIGDGVNDVPALKSAQVAVAMRSGSDMARAVADVVLLNDAFTVLPTTFQEGRRIRNGLVSTMELFLTRTFYTLLIICAAALGGGTFPVAFRQSTLVAALAVGLPAFALALWAQPGKVERRALPAVFDVVVPAAATIALAGFAVYQASLMIDDHVAVAQSALTALTIVCGLLLIPFLRPPTAFWVGAAEPSRDWRPTVFAGLMFVLYLAVLFVPPLQMFYELEPLPLFEYLLIAAIVPVWALTLRLIWRRKLMSRLRGWTLTMFQRVPSRMRRHVLRHPTNT